MNCFKCNLPLEKVFDLESQPSEGVRFVTHGNYGSTVFDPMDGSYLVINICDECMKRPQENVVMVGMDSRPVSVEGYGICGWERIDRPEIPWTPEMPGFLESDQVNFSTIAEALDYKDDPRIHWNIDISKLEAQ